jgi:Bromodomain
MQMLNTSNWQIEYFDRPVPLENTDYYDKIAQPMDMLTVQNKVS